MSGYRNPYPPPWHFDDPELREAARKKYDAWNHAHIHSLETGRPMRLPAEMTPAATLTIEGRGETVSVDSSELVQGLLPSKGMAQIFGEPGAGKSFLAWDLCAAISNGEDWVGRATQQGDTLYIAAEGATSMRVRKAAWEKEHPFDTCPYLLAQPVNILDDAQASALLTAIEDKGVSWALIVLDSQAAVTEGGDENSGLVAGKLTRFCTQLSESTGALVMSIHHPTKANNRNARGHGSVFAALSAQIHVERRRGDERKWTLTKSRDRNDTNVSGLFALRSVGDTCTVEHLAESERVGSAVPRRLKGDNQKVALKVIRESGESDSDDIVAKVLTTRQIENHPEKRRDVRVAMQKLADAGLIWMREGKCGAVSNAAK